MAKYTGKISMSYHSRMTSIGTKRAIRPYWARYHRGKDKAQKCPFHMVCLDLANNDKRYLYAHACAFCKDSEGYPRAYTRENYHMSWEWVKERKYKREDGTYMWLVDADANFQKEKAKLGA